MNREALFCDGTARFVTPAEPEPFEKVRFRFRTAENDVDFVRIIIDGIGHIMNRGTPEGIFDYYEIDWQMGDKPFCYFFEVNKREELCYYNRFGVCERPDPHYDFRIVPGFHVPEWAKGAVMYQIYVDRFYNGDKDNDVTDGEYIYIGEPVVRVTDWEKYPAYMGVREFYGGDLQGVLEKLDYLQELGVGVIYFNPLFVSPSNHKYDIQDYDHIDPHIGRIIRDGSYRTRVTDRENLKASDELFIRLVQEMHDRGMKVILDGVFNHCGSFNKWMDAERIYEGADGYEPGAYISEDSPYRSYFHFLGGHWPYNADYDGWWGHNTLPKLNYEASPELESHILNIAEKWILPPFCVDGWRLDVAADLGHSPEYNHMFWKKFRRTVKNANPDALILAEHYGNPRDWLGGDEWDTVMNYDAFMEPVTWFLTGMEKHSDEANAQLCGNAEHFIHAMKYHMANMLTPSLYVAMNELSNHDHSRFLTRTNHMVGRVRELGHEAAAAGVQTCVMREAVILQMTWPGAPTIYYGDEAGVCGFTDPDNRRTYPWGKEDKELLLFHQEAVHIHRSFSAFLTGSLIDFQAEGGMLVYGRFTDREQTVIAIHHADQAEEIRVPVWRMGVPDAVCMRRLIYSYEDGYTTEPAVYEVHDGEICFNMGRYSAIILYCG